MIHRPPLPNPLPRGGGEGTRQGQTRCVDAIAVNADTVDANAAGARGLISRRDLLARLCAAPWLTLGGCQTRSRLPPEGRLVDSVTQRGHRMRDGWRPQPADDAWQDVDVIIVGGGVAGLSAARELRRMNIDRFVLLEMDEQLGGTAQSTQYGSIPAPWGAHYLPAPMPHQSELITLLDEMGVLEGRGPDAEPIVAEQYLCREPEERIFHDGVWHEGLFLFDGASADDLRQWSAVQAEFSRWANWRDARGRRAFAIPVSQCSDDAEVTRLDSVSFADWLQQHGWTSPRVRWSLDYACRDDYGLTLTQTSAWAGIFYFAARLANGTAKPQALITWPEGNGRIVDHLRGVSEKQIHSGSMVTEVRPLVDSRKFLEVIAVSTDDSVRGYRARCVIWAAPQFVAGRVISGLKDDPDRAAALREFRYGCWFVANLCLSDRPASQGVNPAWDNVFYDSPSLGYVAATHQMLKDHGPTVWTYYYPLCGDDPAADRKWLLDQSWESLAERVLADIELAHPEIRRLTTRLDVLRWGHGMIRPEPGFVWSAARLGAARPWRGIHFAHTDLSGVALCEEAFDHGVRAAREVIAALG